MTDSFAIQRVASIATLRGIPVSSTRSVHLLSYYSGSSGGGGDFNPSLGAAPGTYVDDGGTIIVPTGGDGSSAWIRETDGYVNVKQFGAKGDGVTDDASAITAALNYLQANGGVLDFLSAHYKHSSQLVFTAPILHSWILSGSNATLIATSAITTSQFKIIGGNVPYVGTFSGFVFDLSDNTTLQDALELTSTYNLRVCDNVFITQNSGAFKANFGCITIRTPVYWNIIERNTFRPFTVGNPDACVRIEGACNALVIRNNNFSTGSYGIKNVTVSGVNSNSVNIDANWFEGVGICISVDGNVTNYWPAGWNVTKNRAEAVTTFFKMNQIGVGTVNNHSRPPILSENYLVSGSVTNHIVKPSGAIVINNDSAYYGVSDEILLLHNNNINIKTTGNVGVANQSGGQGHDGGHLTIGTYHLWIDATGNLRIKSSAPISDTDGTVVGTQT